MRVPLVDLPISRRRRLPIVALTACLAAATATRAADLTDGEKKLLADAQTHMQKVEASLKLAAETAGPGEGKPAGSKARLALVRLDSAKQALPQVSARLEKLPVDHPEVQSLRQRYDATVAAITQMESRLTGQAPASAGEAPEEVKLDYRQEEQLKNARFYLRELVGKAEALDQLSAQVQQAADPGSIDHREVSRGMNTIAVAEERVAAVRQHLSGLPADGQGVKTARDELDQIVARLDRSRQVLAPLHERLSAQIDTSKYPALAADTERLRELARMFADTRVLTEDRGQAAEIVRQGPAALAERDRVLKEYAPLIQQKTEAGNQLSAISEHLTAQHKSFTAAADVQKSELPAAIQADLAQARELAAQAVAEQKPAFFAEGIPQRLGWAEEKLALLEVLDPQGAIPMRQQVEQVRQELKQAQVALRDAIIDANTLPADLYSGADRDELSKLASNALKEQLPGIEVLAVRIPAQGWKREVMWRHQTSSWYKIDRSRLQVQLVVKHDDKLAAVRPVNLWMDHVNGDQLSAIPFYTADEELPPQALLRLEKVR